MYKNILVAIDDSETSQCALKEALHIARTSKAKLYIAHVTDEALLNVHGHVFAHMAEAEAGSALKTLAEAGQKLLVDAMLQADGVDAEAVLLQANNRRISETIVEKSKTLNIDLIIIGRHGRRGLATFILGSAAEQISRIADASVLLVRKH